MNLLVHIFSAVVFLVLILMIVKLQNRLKLAKKLVIAGLGPGKEGWILADPLKFIEEFCSLASLEFHNESQVDSREAQKIFAGKFQEMVAATGARLIRYTDAQNGSSLVEIVGQHPVDLSNEQMTCLGKGVTIKSLANTQ